MKFAKTATRRRGATRPQYFPSSTTLNASAVAIACAICQSAKAQTAPPATLRSARLPDVVVQGTIEPTTKGSLSALPEAQPVSTTTVTQEQIAKENISTYGDLFRSMTGVSVNNFGQGGVGYGISLRGFPDGDHGREGRIMD